MVSKRALKHVLGEIRDASGLSLALFGGKGELLALSEGEGQLFEELEKEGLVGPLKRICKIPGGEGRENLAAGRRVSFSGRGNERGEGFVLAGTGKEDVLPLLRLSAVALSGLFRVVGETSGFGTFFSPLILGPASRGGFRTGPAAPIGRQGPAGCIFNKSKGGWL